MAQSETPLPATLPIFPLAGALLLPRARLPLNIFEPRYVAMVEDALAAGRLIGMVQPRLVDGSASDSLYTIGCAGRIASFSETGDGRYLIVLNGVSRFMIGEEVATLRGYRRVQADWSPFTADVATREDDMPRALRGELLEAIRPYFKSQGIVANWDTIEEATPERLVASLCGSCPFETGERQALLEAPTLSDRAMLLLKLLRMASPYSGAAEESRH